MGGLLDSDAIATGLIDLDGWDRAGDDAIRATYRLPGFSAAMAFVDAVATAAERADHHPDIDIRYDRVTFTCSTHSAGGVTSKDLALAGEIATMAQAAAAAPVVAG